MLVIVIVAVIAAAAGGIIAGVVVFGDDSSGPSGPPRFAYPKAAAAQLLSACENRSSHATCACILRAYQDTMPYTAYRSITHGGVRYDTRAYFLAFGRASAKCPQ